MKQLFYTKRGRIALADVPAPSCGSRELLVATHWSVISAGTETKSLKAPPEVRAERRRSMVRRGLEVLRADGASKLVHKVRDLDNLSSELGYSAAGVVVEVGRDVVGFQAGDRVACAGGGYASHAEVIRVPPLLATPVPDAVDLRQACWTTMGAIALQGVRRAAPQLGELVVVTGLGLLGLLSVQILRASGCRVVALDIDPGRIERARAFGAEAALDARQIAEVRRAIAERSAGIGADAVLLCATTQSSEPMREALELVRQRGRVVVVGDVGMELPRSPFYAKEAEVTISCSYGPGRYDSTYEEQGLDYPPGFVRWTENRNMQAFLQLLAEGRVDTGALVTHTFSIAEGAAAYDVLVDPEQRALGVLLRYAPASERPANPDLRRVVAVTPGKRGGAIEVAAIGLGGFATGTHLPNLAAHGGFALRYAVSRSGRSAAREARSFRARFASTDWHAAFADPELDAAVISTRHDSHAQLAAAALRAGKHVLVEKPLGLTHQEIDDVLAAQACSGAVLAVGHNRRFSPAARLLAEELRRLGGPVVLLCRVNAGAIPASHWTQDPAVGGGRIIGEVCHFIDLCLYLAGDGVAISRAQATCVPPDGRRVPCLDNLTATFELGDGSLATILYTSSGHTSLAKERVEAHCQGRSFVIDDFRSLTSHGGTGGPSWSSARQDKGHAAEIDAFAKAIRGEASPLPSPRLSAEVARLAIDIDSALRTRGGTPA